MPNTHFRHIITPKGGEAATYAGPDVASERTARSHLDHLFPVGPRIQLERYEMRSDSWRPVLTRDFDSPSWVPQVRTR